MADNNEPVNKVLLALGLPTIVAVFVLLTIPFSLLYAWATQTLYIWFIQTPFPHAPHPNLWEVWGVMMLLQMIIVVENKSEEGSKAIWQFVGRVLGIFVALIIGYIIKGHIRV